MDFSDWSLTFRHFESGPEPLEDEPLRMTVTVNGHETKAKVDQAARRFLLGPLSLAKEYGMHLEELSLADGTVIGYKSQAKIQILGKDFPDVFYNVAIPEYYGKETIMGNYLIDGLRFHLHDDKTWEVTRPALTA